MTREQAIERAKELYPPKEVSYINGDTEMVVPVITERERKAYLKGWVESQEWTKVEDEQECEKCEGTGRIHLWILGKHINCPFCK